MPIEYGRVLFVDDEESIRIMLSAVLEQHGFKVRTASSVPEALVEINASRFDVLICDLNLDKPGDGFLVLAAMRHLHPDCVNLILTGYPAFETALEAMHNQVDDYLVKPADIELLLGTIERKLSTRKEKKPGLPTRLVDLLRESSDELAEATADAIDRHPELSSISVPRADRIPQIESFLSVIARPLEEHQDGLGDEAQKLALDYGKLRLAQKFTVRMVVLEFQTLERSIGTLVRNNLSKMAIAGLFYDYERLHRLLGGMLLKALEVYEIGTPRPNRKSNRGSVASE